ncbi:Erg28-like protein [Lentinus tigrinus ALCF2SS1-7]|uniref:Erg28-like protein n=1 Tax=Lentinus tigrinus ALCF2SS1-6 TaxID=1328759 RepID=A0A5C2SI63_9APHY|nr:Erg28-like protein [Lentinus tigrinus ALCF2SS1-6]RPD75159.1 Erg28-like protein [Lentinus tigrinus ALCF2SS1-7]
MAILDVVSPYLPQGPGYLPAWLLFVAVTAAINTVSNMTSLTFSRKLYKDAFVNPVQARTFGIWTLTSAAIRFYAAYNINNKQVYDLALFSYLFALLHFGTELVVYRSVKIAAPVFSPVVVASSSLIWMFTQYNFYVQA